MYSNNIPVPYRPGGSKFVDTKKVRSSITKGENSE